MEWEDAVMGTGTARGEERAVLAAQQAICSPLLDNQSIKGAKAALVNVTGNKKMTMREVDAATKLIYEEAGQEVHLIFGCVVDENMDDELKVTVIATGFNRTPIEDIEYKKEIQKNEFHKNTNDLMETSNTTLYNQKNENSLNDENFDQQLTASEKPVLVDYWAEWCGPCRMVGPIIDELSQEYDGKAVVGKVDVDNNQEFAAKLEYEIFQRYCFLRMANW